MLVVDVIYHHYALSEMIYFAKQLCEKSVDNVVTWLNLERSRQQLLKVAYERMLGIK